MSFQYATSDENGEIFDELTDSQNGLRIRVGRTGGELVSISRKDASGNWQGFLYRDGLTQAPASGWANHATVMGYFTHRLFQEQSNYEGHPIHAGNHGFVRHFAFAAPADPSESGALTYYVPADQIPKEAYPYRVSLHLTYRLAGGALEVEFSLKNEESHDVHLSFGLHPGFAVSSIEAFRLLMPAGKYKLLETSDNFLNGNVTEILHQGGDMPFSRKTLVDSYLLDIQELENRAFVLEDADLGHRIELDYSEVPYITIWSDGNPYLCVEPCWGVPDSNPPVPFEQKLGIQKIASGKVLKKSFRLTPDFLIK